MTGLTGTPRNGNGLDCLRDFGTFFMTRDWLATSERSCETFVGELVSAPDVIYTEGLTGDKLCLLAKLITGMMARTTKNVKNRCMFIPCIVYRAAIQTDPMSPT